MRVRVAEKRKSHSALAADLHDMALPPHLVPHLRMADYWFPLSRLFWLIPICKNSSDGAFSAPGISPIYSDPKSCLFRNHWTSGMKLRFPDHRNCCATIFYSLFVP